MAQTDSYLLAHIQTANDIVQHLTHHTCQDLNDPLFAPFDQPRAIATTLVKELVIQLRVVVAYVGSYNPMTTTFETVAQHSADPMIDGSKLLSNYPPLQQAIIEHQPFLNTSLDSSSGLPDLIQGLAAYPITLGSPTVGSLIIMSHQPLTHGFLEVLKFITSSAASAMVNAHQTAQLQYQAGRDGLIRQISQQLRQSLDSKTMIQTLVEQVGRALRADRCDFLQMNWPLLSPFTDCPTATSYTPPTVVASYFKPGSAQVLPSNLLYEAIFNQPNLVSDLMVHQCLALSDTRPVAADSQGAILLIPLLLQHQYQEEVLGFLALGHQEYHNFQDIEIELIQAVATQASLALSNAQLFEQTRQQGEREALLNQVTNTLHQSLHWDQIVSTTMVSLRETLDLSRCCFFSVQVGSQTIEVTYEAHLPHLDPTAGPYSLVDFGPFQQRIGQGLTVQMSDLQASELPPKGQAIMEQLKMQSGVLIPVYTDRSSTLDLQTPVNTWVDTPASSSEQSVMIGLIGAFKETVYGWQSKEVELLQSVAQQLAIALTRSQLFSHVQQQAERLALLNSMTAVIRSSLQPERLFQAITQEIGEAFEADICTLALWQPEAESLHPVGIYAPCLTSEQLEQMMPGLMILTQQSQQKLGLRIEGSAAEDLLQLDGNPAEMIPESTRQRLKVSTELLLQTKSPIILADSTSSSTAFKAHEGVLLVPLLEGDDLIGCLGLKRLQSDPDHPWSATDLKVAEAVAAQAAIAISQAQLLTQTQQLLTQTQRQANQASLINRMTDRIRYSLNLDDMLQAAVQEVGQALQASRVLFLFVNPCEQVAKVRHAYAKTEAYSWLNRDIPLENNPLAPDLIDQKDPIVINVWPDIRVFDVKTQARLSEAHIRSIMLARLHLGSNHYGILSVHQCDPTTPVPYKWSQTDQDLLKLVAEQLVIAINQSRLYEKTQQQARREALLNEITTQIRTSLDPKQVLESIVESLAKTLELDRCEISLYPPDLDPSSRLPTITMIWSQGSFIKRASNLMPTSSHSIQSDSAAVYGSQPGVMETLCQGQPFVLSNTDLSMDQPDVQAWYQKNPFQNLALIPIIQSGTLLGTITMILMPQPHTSHQFQPDELSLAMAVAEQAGIALQQAQLYEQTRIAALRERLLRHLAQKLSSTYDPAQIVQIALESMADALQVNKCSFISLTRASDVEPAGTLNLLSSLIKTDQKWLSLNATEVMQFLQQKAADQSPETSSEGLKVQQEYRRSPAAPSCLGQVLSLDLSWLILLDCYGRHDSLFIEDVGAAPLPPQTRQQLLNEQVQSILCVPLMTDGTTVAGVMCAFVPPSETGMLTATDIDSRSLSNADTELVRALADIAAVALQRAQFYERGRRQETTAAAIRGLTEGREAESRRLAADLHDQTLADLGALSRQLQNLALDPAVGTSGQQALQQMSNQLRDTIAELRGIVEDLQPTAMRAFNLGPALRSLLERAAQRSIKPLVTRFDDRSDDLLNQLEPVAQSTVFRIVQEALNNAVKHAQASRIDITIAPEATVNLIETKAQPETLPSHLEVKIIDDGIGMPDHPDGVGRHGLMNMRYRAELIGASIEWRSRRSGSGTVVRLWIPLSPSS